MEEISVGGDRSRAEFVEVRSHVDVARGVERGGDDRSVARPHVAVRIAGEGGDVVIVGGDDRAAVVDLRAQDQEALQEEIDHLRRQLAVVEAIARDPQPPERVGAAQVDGGAARPQALGLLADVAVRLAHAEEHRARRLAIAERS